MPINNISGFMRYGIWGETCPIHITMINSKGNVEIKYQPDSQEFLTGPMYFPYDAIITITPEKSVQAKAWWG